MDIFNSVEFWYFLIPVIIGILFWYDGKSTRDEKEHMLTLFKSNQILSMRIQTNIKKLIYEYNIGNEIAFPERNVTYNTYLDLMKEEYKTSLSDELFESLKISKFKKPRILSHIESLSKQNDALILIDIDMKRISRTLQEY